MNYCMDCFNYDDDDTYPSTGFCTLHDTYVKEQDTCEDFEEIEE